MEIRFETKEESNKRRQEEFLKLSGHERFMAFLKLMQDMKQFPTSAKPEKKDNFVIEINMDNAAMG